MRKICYEKYIIKIHHRKENMLIESMYFNNIYRCTFGFVFQTIRFKIADDLIEISKEINTTIYLFYKNKNIIIYKQRFNYFFECHNICYDIRNVIISFLI